MMFSRCHSFWSPWAVSASSCASRWALSSGLPVMRAVISVANMETGLSSSSVRRRVCEVPSSRASNGAAFMAILSARTASMVPSVAHTCTATSGFWLPWRMIRPSHCSNSVGFHDRVM